MVATRKVGKMKYLSQCTDVQIKELMRCYSADYTEIEIKKMEDYIDITLIVGGIPESYTLMDYTVTNYDWDDTNENCLHDYREKMLEFFGDQYAIDYLLNC